eukprot:5853645-Prymnesium_polylepis.1
MLESPQSGLPPRVRLCYQTHVFVGTRSERFSTGRTWLPGHGPLPWPLPLIDDPPLLRSPEEPFPTARNARTRLSTVANVLSLRLSATWCSSCRCSAKRAAAPATRQFVCAVDRVASSRNAAV